MIVCTMASKMNAVLPIGEQLSAESECKDALADLDLHSKNICYGCFSQVSIHVIVIPR